jgi:type VI secretion system protein ImpK
MSNPKDPFDANSGGKTVFRPNPVHRRPQAPAEPPARHPGPTPSESAGAGQAKPAVQPYTQNTAPAYPKPLPDDRMRATTGGDEWISSTGRPPEAAFADMPRAEDLRFEELAAPNENPVMRAACPLLLLLGRLRVAMVRASFASLMEQVAEAINFFDRTIRSAGVTGEHANTAKYLICATADDIVQNIPTDDRHVWTQYSMLSRFFGERTGGVRFFEELDRLKSEPAANYNVLELQHACLALGFQGVHRTSAGGAAQLQLIQRNLYETLRRVRAKVSADLSPRWRGQSLAARTTRSRIPVWAIAGIAALLVFATFVAFKFILSSQSEAAAAEAIGLHPNTPVSLQRRLPAPPIQPTPAQLTQLQRIRAALGPGVDGCTITADLFGRWIAIRVCSVLMFESGQAAVLPPFRPIAQKIAQIIENEVGPVRIVGHTDNQPLNPLNRFKDNQQLSIERAKAAAALIAPSLTQSDRLTVEGRGPDEPIDDNHSPAGRAKNRRVEFLITRID